MSVCGLRKTVIFTDTAGDFDEVWYTHAGTKLVQSKRRKALADGVST